MEEQGVSQEDAVAQLPSVPTEPIPTQSEEEVADTTDEARSPAMVLTS